LGGDVFNLRGEGAAGTFACGCTIAALGLALTGCTVGVNEKYGVKSSPRMVGHGQPVPKGGGKYRVGEPYVINGQVYVPREVSAYSAEGHASWYGHDFHGRLTANGEIYNMHGISAAHPTLPLPSYVRVTNLENRRSLVVRVNDRGPFHQGRLIDLSVRAAKLLGFYDKGVARVRVEYLGRASLSGSDDTKLAGTLRADEPNGAPVRVAASAPVSGPVGGPLVNPYAPRTPPTAVLIGRGLY
jgi:rare lipoprotein A